MPIHRVSSFPSLLTFKEHKYSKESERWGKILTTTSCDGFKCITQFEQALNSGGKTRITGEQQAAIEDYVGNSYSYVNDWLLTNSVNPIRHYCPHTHQITIYNPRLECSTNEFICREERLCDTLEQLPTTSAAILYKGSLKSVDLLEKFESGLILKGDQLTNVTFLSATGSPFSVIPYVNQSNNKIPDSAVVFEFTVTPSFKNISMYSPVPEECESLCSPNKWFDIREIARINTEIGKFLLVKLNEAEKRQVPAFDFFGRSIS